MCKKCGCNKKSCKCNQNKDSSGLSEGKPPDTQEIQRGFEEIEAQQMAKKEEENARRQRIISDFVCRICNGRGCNFIPTGNEYFGGDMPTRGHYECNGCSVHFSDPEKFSKNSSSAIAD